MSDTIDDIRRDIASARLKLARFELALGEIDKGDARTATGAIRSLIYALEEPLRRQRHVVANLAALMVSEGNLETDALGPPLDCLSLAVGEITATYDQLRAAFLNG